MDKLEKFIIENRDDFNIYEPSAEVWDKIQKSSRYSKIRKLNWKTVVWRAAIILIIFGAAFTLSEVIHREPGEVSDKLILKQIPELAEAEAYYTSLVNSKLAEINKQLSDDPELHQKILKDVSELDNMYEDLKKDLYDNIATQEIVEAMIQNYRLKLEILEEILNDLQKREKANENESIQYEL